MDCGVPFVIQDVHLEILIPDFNDAVYNKKWKNALEILHSTNNFLNLQVGYVRKLCEAACVLGLINPPVSIEMIEKYIVERGFKEGWIKAQVPAKRTGKKIA